MFWESNLPQGQGWGVTMPTGKMTYKEIGWTAHLVSSTGREGSIANKKPEVHTLPEAVGRCR